MRKNPGPFPLVLFLMTVLGCLPELALSAGWELVTGVMDGDTIQLAKGQRVRYLGIDTPERGGDGSEEFLAEEAYLYNRRLVLNKEVRLEAGPEGRDRHGRVLAHVFLSNGLFVNGELIKKGLAQVLYHGPGMERFAELLQWQREAIQDTRGIWAKALKETDDLYRGHGGSRRFHRQDCSLGKKIVRRNLVLFPSKKEAYRQGYSPCRICKP
ncbi:MAG: thermonuclease family protein [Pseudomonadota bacterium]